MSKKINLILDLDETLINTVNFNFSNYETTDLVLNVNSTVGIISLPNYLNLVFLRPYLKEFLSFCFLYFNVSFWTAGSRLYCQEVLKLILNNNQYNETVMILAKEESCWINLKDNKIFYCENTNKVSKKLKFLWDDHILGKIFSPEDTLIVDDNPKVIIDNPANSLNIIPYLRTYKNDKILCQVSNWLYLCKDVDDVRTLEKDLVIIPEKCHILDESI